MNRGQFVILALVGLGVAAAGLAVWVHYRSEHQSLAYWGPDNALLIRDAPRVELWRLAPLGGDQEDQHVKHPPADEKRLLIDGQQYVIAERVEIARAAGASRFRHALLQDESFQKLRAGTPPPRWSHAIVLGDEKQPRQLTILIDLPAAQLQWLGADQPRSFVPLAKFMKHFLAGVLPEPTETTPRPVQPTP